jgi:hypothetical protein
MSSAAVAELVEVWAAARVVEGATPGMRVRLGLEFGAAVVGGLGRAPDGPATVGGRARDVVEPNTGRVAVVIAGGGWLEGPAGAANLVAAGGVSGTSKSGDDEADVLASAVLRRVTL